MGFPIWMEVPTQEVCGQGGFAWSGAVDDGAPVTVTPRGTRRGSQRSITRAPRLPREPSRAEGSLEDACLQSPARVPWPQTAPWAWGWGLSLLDVSATSPQGQGEKRRGTNHQVTWRPPFPRLLLSETQKLCMTDAGLIKGHLQFQNVPECVWQTAPGVLIASSPTVRPHFGEVVPSRHWHLLLTPVCVRNAEAGAGLCPSRPPLTWSHGQQLGVDSRVPAAACQSPFRGAGLDRGL